MRNTHNQENSSTQEVIRWPKYHRKVGWQKIDLQYKWAYRNLPVLGKYTILLGAVKWSIFPQISCCRGGENICHSPQDSLSGFVGYNIHYIWWKQKEGKCSSIHFSYVFSLRQSPTFTVKFDFFNEFLT